MNFFGKSSLKVGLIIFAVCMAVYHINGKPIGQTDCAIAPYAAWALVRNGSFDVGCYKYLDKYQEGVLHNLSDGRRVSCYPPGSTLAAVPIIAPIALFSREPLSSGKMRRIGKLVGAFYASLAVVVFYFICLDLVVGGALLGSVLFAFGTSMWSVAAQSLWVHGPAVFFLCVALYLILVKRGYNRFGLSCGIGLVLGVSVLCRPTNVVFLVCVGLIYLLFRKWRNLLGVVLCSMVSLVVLLIYNCTYFSQTVYGGYGHMDNFWSTPLFIGLAGLLFAPSRGLFVYTPAFIFVFWGLIKLFRLDRSYNDLKISVSLWVVGVIGVLCIYSKWYCWWGAWCYGPRLLSETLPIFSLLFAYGYAGIKNRFMRKTAIFLVVLSVMIHFIGVFGSGNDWDKRYSVGAYGKKLFSLKDTQIQAYIKHLFSIE